MNLFKKALILLVCCVAVSAAKNLPVESSLITGQLENGLKYTIKKNAKPANTASLRLMVEAGSLEEDDDQKGIAHFVEHMAFNGTKNFEGNDIIKFLETLGVGFGSHLNANTGTTRTMYKLEVPLKNDNLEKAMLVFSDWAGEIVFTEEEINKERGVILEEARARNNLRFRLFLQAKDVYYANSKYKDRTPIGDLDIIRNISRERIKAFYDDWYRPELMHFAIVGDFDVKKVEALVKKTFSSLKNDSTRKQANREVPMINETRVLVVKDKELTSANAGVTFYEDSYNTLTEGDYRKDLSYSIISSLFNSKGSEQGLKINPAAKSINLRLGSLGKNLLSFNFTASFYGFNEIQALEELTNLMYSIEKYGFNKKDFQRIIKKMKNANKAQLKSLANKPSKVYADQIVALDERDEIFIDEKYKSELENKLLDEITLEEINKLYKSILANKSRLISYQLPENQEVSKRRAKTVLSSARDNVKEQEKQIDLPDRIIDVSKLKPAKIVEEKYNEKYDFYEFTLENGIKVAYKFNDYNKNKVSLNAFSKGGLSLIDTKDLTNARFALRVIGKSGYDKYNVLDSKKIYSDKQVRFQPYIMRYGEGLNGSTITKDFEYLLEFVYMFANKYRFDENIFANTKLITLADLKKEDRAPGKRFSKEFMTYKYEGNKRYTPLVKEEVETLNKEDMIRIYKDRFADFNNFMFVIVGDISKDEIKKQISKYLGNLPTMKREETFNFRGAKPVKGKHKFVRFFNNENISDVILNYTKEVPYTKEESIKITALKDVLNTKLRELIREEKSGVYGISVRTTLIREPYSESAISISFTCNPKRKDELVKYVKQTIDSIKKDLVEEKYVNSFVKKRLINLEEAKKQANFWSGQLKNHYHHNDSLDIIEKYDDILKSLTPETIRESANKYLDTPNIIYTELNPKSMKK